MKISVIISSNDAETVWNAFRFSTTSLIYENDVSIFLLGKGVEATSVSTSSYNVEEQMELFRENGGKLIGCGVCCESRKENMPGLEQSLQCEMASMQNLYALAVEADKVLTF